ncbi:MAG: S-methyl-5-thioribose-1-phosphate isomerase, partial [Spirochaetales bacterium]|nr:S-methyl-5-thioribose-1-phosphate isomerase [Spirochaetales bacterium]
MDEDFRTIEFKDNTLYLIDQRVLPLQETFFSTQDYRDVEFAIRDMVVRGAPAIGATAAYGFYLAALELSRKSSTENFFGDLKSAADFLDKARPTAVNLHWALKRMMRTAELQTENQALDAALPSSMASLLETLLKEADSIRIE